MATLAQWIDYAKGKGLTVRECPLQHSDGMIYGNIIALRKGMSETEKTCIIAEEIGHYELTVGNILDQTNVNNRKQECKARRWSFNHQIRQTDLIEAAKHGCASAFEVSEYLGVTESFLNEAIQDFRKQYGVACVMGNYAIIYEPYLMLVDLEENWICGIS